ncbi:DUF1800 family protein [Alteriqipengyuania sp. WL0013]|uniref:DUF1800 domain-containing protein n=1 Tax=Alteriqipengyuania sp. WL0013 TaxID=3110773 RepID=UPI002B8CE0DC|nr:DUF1800 family protein [Alteriqipengyuania sp. WL0013]MEB3414504.1 DUF1800 family protein [Alteriqipengyuania sp. WL0013]
MRDESAAAAVAERVAEDGGVEADFSSTGSTKIAKVAAMPALAATLAACGGGGSGSSGGGSGSPGGGTSGGTATVRKPASDGEASRFIGRAALGASDGTISTLKSRGFEPWLRDQMALPNDRTAIDWLRARNFDAVDDRQLWNRHDPGDHALWNQLMTGGSQVRKHAALALSEFFVVGFSSLDFAWRSFAIAHYWDLLNRHAFGSFRALLEDVTLSPAMGDFLNTRGNRKADPSSGRVPDENYAREVMQLFSIGLYELNADGSVKTGSDGEPLETYTNEDVEGLAKVFTGYDFDFTGVGTFPHPDNANWTVPRPEWVTQSMTADASKWRWPRGESYHSGEEKRFLGTVIPAGSGAAESLRIALDALTAHPNVGPFFGKQMIQRLVTSNPSPAYVGRVAAVFDNDGSGARGNLGAVFRAILLDEEALSLDKVADPFHGRLREPMVRLAQWARTFRVRSASGNWEVRDLSNSDRLGQSPLRSPSVFNFFRPGFIPPRSQASVNDMVAPEFQIVNETTVPAYINYLRRAVEGSHWTLRDVTSAYPDEIAIADDAGALLDRLDLLLTGGQLSDFAKTTIRAALDAHEVTATSTAEAKLRRIHTGVFLVMAAPDYLVQK